MKLVHNRYLIDGRDVVELVEKYGSPVYVYQTSKMKQQYDSMLHAFKEMKVKINFACNALNNLNVPKFIKSIGSGLDAVSIQEVQLGLLAGFKPQDIMF